MRYIRGRAARGVPNGVNIDLIRARPSPRVFYGLICNSMAAQAGRVARFSSLCARPPPGPLSGYIEREDSPLPMVGALNTGAARRPFKQRKYCRRAVKGVLFGGGVQVHVAVA